MPNFSEYHIFNCKLEEPIFAIDWERVTSNFFKEPNILLVTVACKKHIHLFYLKNFEPILKVNEVPTLEPLKISISSTYFINKLKIVHEVSPDGKKDKNALFVVWGDDMGYLSMFDFERKRKVETHGVKVWVEDKVKSEKPYHQIRKIMLVKNYLICLKEKEYKRGNWYKKLIHNYFANYFNEVNESLVDQSL